MKVSSKSRVSVSVIYTGIFYEPLSSVDTSVSVKCVTLLSR